MDKQLKENLLSSKHWMRFFYMVFFAVCMQVASMVMWVLVILQFLFALVSGSDNAQLRAFGQSLSTYIHQTLNFLTYNSEDKPFPFMDWPEVQAAHPVVDDAEPNFAAEEGAVQVTTREVVVDDATTASEPRSAKTAPAPPAASTLANTSEDALESEKF